MFEALVFERMRENGLLSAISILAIALGATVVVAIGLTNGIVLASLASNAGATLNRVNLQIVGPRRGFDEQVLARVRGLPGIVDAQPVIEGTLAVKPAGKPLSTVALRAVGVDLLEPLPRDAEIREHLPGAFAFRGSAPYPDLLVLGGGAIISAQVADRYHLSLAKSFEVAGGARPVSLRVAGILPRLIVGIDSSVIFVDISTAQELFNKFGELDRIDCVVDPAQLGDVPRRISALLPRGVRAVQRVNDSAGLQQLLFGLQGGLKTLSYATFVLAGLLIYNIVAVSVVRRRREIGVLRTLGATRGQVLLIFLFEAAALGLLASLIAFPASVLLAQWSVDGGAAIREYNGFATLAMAMFVSAVLTLTSTLAPAIDAARIPPAVALDGHVIEASGTWPTGRVAIVGAMLLALGPALLYFAPSQSIAGYGGGAAIIAGFSLCMPFLLALAVRLLRQAAKEMPPSAQLAFSTIGTSIGRTGLAVVSLTFAVGTLVSILILVGSFRGAVTGWTDQALPGDLTVQPMGASRLGQVRLSSAIIKRMGLVQGVARLAYEGDRAGTLVVYARPGINLLELRSRIVRSAMPYALDVSITQELRRHMLSIFGRTFTLIYALGEISGLISILSIGAALFALVLERREEIGVMRYVGLSTSATRHMVLYQAALIAGLAGGSGIALGALLTFAAAVIIERQAWSTPLHFLVPYDQLAAVFVAVVIAALLAAIYPARVAGHIAASEAADAQ